MSSNKMMNVCNLYSGLMDQVNLRGNKLFTSYVPGTGYGIQSLVDFYTNNFGGWDGISFTFDACDNGADTPTFCRAEALISQTSFKVDTFTFQLLIKALMI